MILEGLVTTRRPDGGPHVAPMGPRVAADLTAFTLRPFQTSHTFHNLLAHPEGVLHTTDDVLLLARAAVGRVDPFPPTVPAAAVAGVVLAGACRAFEFRVTRVDRTADRADLHAEVVRAVTLRDFFGFNRAKHAVVELAVLATRLHLLPPADVAGEFARLKVLVDKTGGPDEHAAFAVLDAHRVAHPGPGGRP